MGAFYTDVKFFNIADRNRSVTVNHVLVDTGSEMTWAPSKTLEAIGVQRVKKDRTFQMDNGQAITRTVGYAIVEVPNGVETVDEVVFGEEGDLPLLGARSLEGLNLRVDPSAKRLVAAGPIPAAARLMVSQEKQ